MLGIPIDIVGGTSIGANVGALLCEERDADKVEKRAKEFSIGMARYTDKIFDLTYPTTSMFTGTLMIAVSLTTYIHCMWFPLLSVQVEHSITY